MKKALPITIGLIFLGIFIWTAVFLYRKSIQPDEIYSTETPFVTDIIKKTVATGSVVPRKEINIKSQVSGVVDKLYIKAGEFVRSGELIAKIRIIPNMVTLNNAESGLNRARINFEDAKKELQRRQDLFNEKLIPEIEYNQYLLNFKRSQEELQAAENNLQLIREGASKKSGQNSNLVKSTVNGMVLDIPVKEGSFVIESNTFNEGTTIGAIADMNEMIFVGKVDESEVGKIKEGMDLNLTIAAIEDKIFKAKLEFISPKGIAEQGAIQFEVRAKVILEEGEFIRAGYSANADIVLDSKKNVLAISEGLLQFGKDSVYVEVETKPQVFEKRLVKLGISDGIKTEVIAGINKNDKIKVIQKAEIASKEDKKPLEQGPKKK